MIILCITFVIIIVHNSLQWLILSLMGARVASCSIESMSCAVIIAIVFVGKWRKGVPARWRFEEAMRCTCWREECVF